MLDKIDTLILENGKNKLFGENALLYVCLEDIRFLASIALKMWNNHSSMRKGFRLE
jgi:hypothetical protein